MSKPLELQRLRGLLAACAPAKNRAPTHAHPTGWTTLDALLDGGLPKGALTELVAHPGAGSGLALAEILRTHARPGLWATLIDGSDCLEPADLPRPILDRLVWIRCRDAHEALRAADVLLRDGNPPLAAIDLRLNPPHDLRRIPASTWFRLQRALAQTSTAALALTPAPTIPSAAARASIGATFHLGDLDLPRAALAARLQPRLDRLRRNPEAQPQTQAA